MAIKTKITVAGYMNTSQPYEIEAWQTKADSRFAAAKPAGKHWDLRHVASGLSMGSLLPPRAVQLAEVLAVIAAWEAHTELDFSPLDVVEFRRGFTKSPPAALLASLREISAAAVN